LSGARDEIGVDIECAHMGVLIDPARKLSGRLAGSAAEIRYD